MARSGVVCSLSGYVVEAVAPLLGVSHSARACHGLDAPHARADRAFIGDEESAYLPVRVTWVPPQSSLLSKPGMRTWRTTAPYFSPKRAIAPS